MVRISVISIVSDLFQMGLEAFMKKSYAPGCNSTAVGRGTPMIKSQPGWNFRQLATLYAGPLSQSQHLENSY